MKILITGTEGYLGSLLAPIMMQQGYEVLAVDTGFYRIHLGSRKKSIMSGKCHIPAA
jgi:nucleoside-diphosphate-sugar epimerase